MDDYLYENSSDEEGNDKEFDEENSPKYRSPAYRRMNFGEIEPIIVTSVLRIVTHYTMELSAIDVESPRFLNDENKTQRLLDTCKVLREITIPSIHKFIETFFFNLHMCRVRGTGVDAVQAPHMVLAESMKKLTQIEAGIKMNMGD